MSPAAAIACFGNATSRKAHVARVVNVAKSRAYDGIDFNYEQLALTTSPATAVKVRAAYSAFIKDVCAGLRAARKHQPLDVRHLTSPTTRLHWHYKR